MGRWRCSRCSCIRRTPWESPKKDAPELDRTVTLAAGIPPEAKEELDLYEGLGEANTANKKLSPKQH